MKSGLNQLLIDKIKGLRPKSSGIMQEIMELLSLPKDAVYRRMRGEVPFTLQEAALIAKCFSFSLDELIGVDLEKSRPLRIKLPDFLHPQEADIYMTQDYIDFFSATGAYESSEIGLVTNALPQEIFSNYDLTTKLNIFRWQYYFNHERVVSFEELTMLDPTFDLFRAQYHAAKLFNKTIYLLDRRIFIRIVTEIEYFKHIRLISQESIKALKEELHAIIDYLDKLTLTGEFAETGHPVYLYVTDMEVPFGCAYFQGGDVEFAMIKTFILTSVTTHDKIIFQKVKDWVMASMKTSTLISKASAVVRTSIIEEQRRIINTLG